MKNFIFNRLTVTMIAALLFACDSKVDLLVDQEANVEQNIPVISVPETFVSAEKAIEVAELFINDRIVKNAVESRAASISLKKNASIETVEENNAPLFYV